MKLNENFWFLAPLLLFHRRMIKGKKALGEFLKEERKQSIFVLICLLSTSACGTGVGLGI